MRCLFLQKIKATQKFDSGLVGPAVGGWLLCGPEIQRSTALNPASSYSNWGSQVAAWHVWHDILLHLSTCHSPLCHQRMQYARVNIMASNDSITSPLNASRKSCTITSERAGRSVTLLPCSYVRRVCEKVYRDWAGILQCLCVGLRNVNSESCSVRNASVELLLTVSTAVRRPLQDRSLPSA